MQSAFLFMMSRTKQEFNYSTRCLTVCRECWCKHQQAVNVQSPNLSCILCARQNRQNRTRLVTNRLKSFQVLVGFPWIWLLSFIFYFPALTSRRLPGLPGLPLTMHSSWAGLKGRGPCDLGLGPSQSVKGFDVCHVKLVTHETKLNQTWSTIAKVRWRWDESEMKMSWKLANTL